MKNTVVVDTNIALKWVLDEPDSDMRQWRCWLNGYAKGFALLAPGLLAYECQHPFQKCS